VDDEPTNIELAASILRNTYDVIPLTSGEKVFKVLEKHHPQLILLDISMPGMDGYEVLHKLKEDPATSMIPIIFLTGKADEEAIIKGFELGAKDYIKKPFNVAELKARVENHLKIFQLTHTLQEKVNEQTINLQDKYNKLMLAKAQVDQAYIAKNEFVSNLNHEIKTPMNAIIGFNELALYTPNLPEQHKDYLLGVKSAAENLMRLIHKTLNFSDSIQNNLKLENEIFHIQTLFDQLSKIFSPKATSKGLSFKIDANVTHTSYLSDSKLLFNTLDNILDNAVKFTHTGEVVLKAYNEANFLVLEIIDTGIGISKENLELLFKPFQQLNGSSTREYGGLGLGLMLCRQIVDLMQGIITIKSDNGIGTNVLLKLPLEVVSSSQEEEKIQSSDEVDDESYKANLQYLEREKLNLDHLIKNIQDCITYLSNGESIDEKFEEIKVDLAVVSSEKIVAQIKNDLDSFSYELAEDTLKNIYEQLKNELQSKDVL